MEVVGAVMFILHIRIFFALLCITVKFPVIKKMEDLLAANLVLTCKYFFQSMDYQIIKSNTGGNILQKAEYRMCSIVLIQSPEQWSGGSMYHIYKANTHKMH